MTFDDFIDLGLLVKGKAFFGRIKELLLVEC